MFASVAIGIASALLATVFFRFVDMREQPSIEVALVVIASMAPFMLAQV
jgi:hypothetical protein